MTLPASPTEYAAASAVAEPFVHDALIRPRPARVVRAIPHPGWTAALRVCLAAIGWPGGVVLLSGAPGTGKTRLLFELQRLLHAAGRQVSRPDMVRDVATEDTPAGSVGADAVLLVDEADRLDREAIRALLRQPSAGVILAGVAFPAALWADLPDDATEVTLEPLAPSDVGPFLADRLDAAGLPRDRIPADAAAALATHSGGSPRVLAILADAALALAALDGSPRVRPGDVLEAAALRDGEAFERTDPVPDPPEALPAVPDVAPRLSPPSRADALVAPLAAGPVVTPRAWRGVLLPLLAAVLLLVPVGSASRDDLARDDVVRAAAGDGWRDPSSAIATPSGKNDPMPAGASCETAACRADPKPIPTIPSGRAAR